MPDFGLATAVLVMAGFYIRIPARKNEKCASVKIVAALNCGRNVFKKFPRNETRANVVVFRAKGVLATAVP